MREVAVLHHWYLCYSSLLSVNVLLKPVRYLRYQSHYHKQNYIYTKNPRNQERNTGIYTYGFGQTVSLCEQFSHDDISLDQPFYKQESNQKGKKEKKNRSIGISLLHRHSQSTLMLGC